MKRIILFTIFVFFSLFSFSQDESEEIIYLAEENIYEENFEYALKLYKEILSETPDDAEINFKIGFCYLNIHNKKGESIEYFKKAIEKYNKRKNEMITPIEMYFYLGKAYHATGEYVLAVENFNKANEYAIAVKSEEAKTIINLEIEMCKSAIDLVASPVSATVTELKSPINTEFDELSPIISELENKIYFTSDYDNNLEDEDYVYANEVYYSEIKNNTWSTPEVQNSLKTFDSDKTACALTMDGMFMLLNIDKNLYVSNIVDNKIQQPEEIEGSNSDDSEYNACYAYNDRAIIFSSDRRKGFGGKDLYIVLKDDKGNWGKPENLGSSVNSEYNEDCPFFFQDSVLYFSSDREISMGGYDIVYTVLNSDSTWSNVINIGYPVNSEEDELSFTMLSSGKKGYFASNRTGTKGKSDIFSVEFYFQDVNYFTLTGTVSPHNVKGTVSIYDDNLNLLYDNVEIKEDGTFSSSLKKNNPYFMSFSIEGYYPVVKTIKATDTQQESYDLKEMVLQYVGINNLYSLNIVEQDLDFKGKLIVENLKKITDKTLYYEINCGLNDIIVGEKVKRQIMKSGISEENIIINSYYETLEKELIIEVSSDFASKNLTINETNMENTTKSLAKNEIDISVNATISKLYTIQIGAFSSAVNIAKYSNLKNVNIYYGSDKFARVTIGEFESEGAANVELTKVISQGYKKAFVRPISYYDNL